MLCSWQLPLEGQAAVGLWEGRETRAAIRNGKGRGQLMDL